jgi:hypothetical protein
MVYEPAVKVGKTYKPLELVMLRGAVRSWRGGCAVPKKWSILNLQ